MVTLFDNPLSGDLDGLLVYLQYCNRADAERVAG